MTPKTAYWHALHTRLTALPPFDTTLCALISRLPAGFSELTLQRRLARDVLEVLSRTVDASNLQKCNPQGQHSLLRPFKIFQPEVRRFDGFWGACTCLGTPDNETTGQPNFEKLVVLAVLSYRADTFSPRRADVLMIQDSRRKSITGIRS